MSSGTLPKSDDQVIKLDYAEASKSAGVSAPKVWPKGGSETKYLLEKSVGRASRTKKITVGALRKAFRAMGSGLSMQVTVERPMREFSIGRESYRFRNPVIIQFEKADGSVASITGMEINGEGPSWELARQNLLHEVHRQFQRLYKTHRMQRTNDENKIWIELEQLIDVEHYKFNRSTHLNCRGQVAEINDRNDIVFDWSGGSKLQLPADCLSAGWANIEVGDWCKALIERQAGDGKIRQAIMLCKIDPPTQITAEESERLWKELPVAELYSIDQAEPNKG